MNEHTIEAIGRRWTVFEFPHHRAALVVQASDSTIGSLTIPANDGGLADLFLGPLAPRMSRDKAAAEEREYVKKLKAKQAKGALERKKYRDSHGGKNKPKPKYDFGGGGGDTF